MKDDNFLYVMTDEMQTVLQSVLIKNGYKKDKAAILANVFSQNSRDGLYTHGINRFSRFVDHTKMGL